MAGWGSGFLAFWGGDALGTFRGARVTVSAVTVLVVTALVVTNLVACPGAGC